MSQPSARSDQRTGGGGAVWNSRCAPPPQCVWQIPPTPRVFRITPHAQILHFPKHRDQLRFRGGGASSPNRSCSPGFTFAFPKHRDPAQCGGGAHHHQIAPTTRVSESKRQKLQNSPCNFPKPASYPKQKNAHFCSILNDDAGGGKTNLFSADTMRTFVFLHV